MLDKGPSKDSLLSHADSLKDLARRARRLSETLPAETDRQRLARYVAELEDNARRIEADAVHAKAR